MMTETEQFLEQLKDPFRFSLRKVCFDFYNDHHNNSRIYDLRIQQVNETQYYYIILETDSLHHQLDMCDDFMDMLNEYVPNHITTSYSKTTQLPHGKYQRIFYAYDESTTIPF